MADFEILDMGPQVFAIKRSAKNQTVCAVTNISKSEITVSIPLNETPDAAPDLISGRTFQPESIRLKPYQYVWLDLK